MFKFVFPAVILFLVVFFWEKINAKIAKKFNIKINNIVLAIIAILLILILILLYF
jgi:hypothetical protein